MNSIWVAPVAAVVGMVLENPRRTLCANQRATLVRGSSITDQCLATALVLTRVYQSDSSSEPLASTASRATQISHLREAAT